MIDEKEGKKQQQLPLQYLIAGLILLVALLIAGYFFWQNQKTQSLLKNPTLAAQIQTQELLTAVGKLMDLPKNETPTIATVSDITKLKGQPFFANAKNGDKVLIYTTAKEAILYRPSENKIIVVAPVNIGNTVVTPTPQVMGAKITPSTSSGSPTPTPAKKPTPTQEK